MNYTDAKFFAMGNGLHQHWNKKLCFESRDTLFDCIDAQPNKNKFRCPDQLYAYEMWCPTEARTLFSVQKRKQERDADMYDHDWVANMNRQKQSVNKA